MAQIYPNEVPQDTQRQQNNEKMKPTYFFQTFGENIHFFYKAGQQQQGDYRKQIYMNAIQERNIFMKSEIRIYKRNKLFGQMEHRQNVLQFFFYPFFTNKYKVTFNQDYVEQEEYSNKKSRQQIQLTQDCCRVCLPFYCCGKVHACTNQSFQILNSNQKTMYHIEGNFQCIFSICQKATEYNIYLKDDKQKIGTIKQENQLCNCLPCHCSCTRMYSPLLIRTFKLELNDEVKQTDLEQLFFAMIFLAKISRSTFY